LKFGGEGGEEKIFFWAKDFSLQEEAEVSKVVFA
jgi:hypothetical protein